MKTIKEKIDILEAKIKTLKIKEQKAIDESADDAIIYYNDNIVLLKELVRDLKVLGKFLGYYLVSTYDENRNKIVLDLDCDSEDVQEIEKYVDECMDDFYSEKE